MYYTRIRDVLRLFQSSSMLFRVHIMNIGVTFQFKYNLAPNEIQICSINSIVNPARLPPGTPITFNVEFYSKEEAINFLHDNYYNKVSG